MTYLEFKSEIEKLSKAIIRKEDKSNNKIVGIRMADKLDVIFLIYALLKAGRTILPLPPEIPDEKVKSILQTIKPDYLISDYDIKNIGYEVISYKELIDCVDCDFECLSNDIDANNTALLLMTSGTTGAPKGCLLGDEQIIGRVFQLQEKFGDENDVILFSTNYSFDVSYSEIFAWPIYGGKLVIMDDGDKFDSIPAYIEQFGITQLSISPSALINIAKNINEVKNITLRHIFVAGEKFPTRLATLFNSFDKEYQIWNMYGPTEASIYVSFYNIDNFKKDMRSVPIGQQLSGVDIKIVNPETGKICEDNEEGEILLSGKGIFNGYYNQEKLTRSKEIEILGKTYYRTGDLGYFSKGFYWINGRIDNQLKVNGMRIEAEEIENIILKSNPFLERAIIRLEEYNSKKILTLFFTSTQDVDVNYLVQSIDTKLEKAFIPKLFVQLPVVRLNKNGKVDEEYLLEKFILSVKGKTPMNQEENSKTYRQLVGVWESVLGVPLLKKEDNFFLRGGDSLDSTKFILEVEDKFGVILNDSFLAQHQTFEKIFQYFSKLNDTKKNINNVECCKNKKDCSLKKETVSRKIKNTFPFFVRQEIYSRKKFNMLLEHSVDIPNVDLESVVIAINKLKESQQLLNCDIDLKSRKFIEYDFKPIRIDEIFYTSNPAEKNFYLDKMKSEMIRNNNLFSFFVFQKNSTSLELVCLFSHYIADGSTLNRFDKLFFDCLEKSSSPIVVNSYQTLIEEVIANNTFSDMQQLLKSQYFLSLKETVDLSCSKFNYIEQSDLEIIVVKTSDLDVLFDSIALEVSKRTGIMDLAFHILKNGLEYNGKNYKDTIADTHNSIYVEFNVDNEKKLYSKSEEEYKKVYIDKKWHLDYLIFSEKYIDNKAMEFFRKVPFNINYIGHFKSNYVGELLSSLYSVKENVSKLQEKRARVTCFTTEELGYIVLLNGFGYDK